MHKKILPVVLVFLSTIIMWSCTKKDPPANNGPDPVGNGSVMLEFMNKAGSADLALGGIWYLNEHGDSFKVNMFNYYISNIKINGTKGTYTQPDSYHLIKQSLPASRTVNLAAVPYDTYSSITFTIGVDSLRNVSGAQTGALDPANDMFWTWSTGYIMLKLEGNSPRSPMPDGAIVFHAGGFSGANATQRTVTLNFPTPIVVSKSQINHVHLDADVLALFKSPNVFDFSATYNITTAGAKAKNLADNYANMFKVSYAGL
jgi:hypothetical protein